MTAPLPPVVLALAAGPGAVLAEASPAGTARVLAGWSAPPPEGALLVHWPARFPWTPPADAFARAVVASGGTVLPLADVLGRLGVRAGRGPAGLLAALAPDLGEDAEPELAARRLVAALWERLAAGASPPPAGATPSPGVAEALRDLPDSPGVYRFLAADGRVLYVGKAVSLRRRVPSHFGSPPPEGEKSLRLAARAAHLDWEPAGSDLEAVLREYAAIRRHRPALNTQADVHARDAAAAGDVLCVLPGSAPGAAAVCVAAGVLGFHWEEAPARAAVPRGLWARVRAAAGGEPGWGPAEPGTVLDPDGARAMLRLARSWLALRGEGAHQLDLAHETVGGALRSRLRVLLGAARDRGRVLPI